MLRIPRSVRVLACLSFVFFALACGKKGSSSLNGSSNGYLDWSSATSSSGNASTGGDAIVLPGEFDWLTGGQPIAAFPSWSREPGASTGGATFTSLGQQPALGPALSNGESIPPVASQPNVPGNLQIINDRIVFSLTPAKRYPAEQFLYVQNAGGRVTELEITDGLQNPFTIFDGECRIPGPCRFRILYRPQTEGIHTERIVGRWRDAQGGNWSNFEVSVEGRAYDPLLVVGAGEGGAPAVMVANMVDQVRYHFYAGDQNARNGARVALGFLNGDIYFELIVAEGRGSSPEVRVYSTQTQPPTLLYRFNAYEPAMTRGITLAACDIDGDESMEIITGADTGGAPRVNVFKFNQTQPVHTFYAFDPNGRFGVRVACADLNEDGKGDIFAVPGEGGGPVLKVFSGANYQEILSQFVGDQNDRSGVHVAAGAHPTSGYPLVVVGNKGRVRAYQPDREAGGLRGAGQVIPYAGWNGEVRVALMLVNQSDGTLDILTGPGEGGGPVLRALSGYNGRGFFDIMVFESGFRGGIYVAGI